MKLILTIKSDDDALIERYEVEGDLLPLKSKARSIIFEEQTQQQEQLRETNISALFKEIFRTGGKEEVIKSLSSIADSLKAGYLEGVHEPLKQRIVNEVGEISTGAVLKEIRTENSRLSPVLMQWEGIASYICPKCQEQIYVKVTPGEDAVCPFCGRIHKAPKTLVKADYVCPSCGEYSYLFIEHTGLIESVTCRHCRNAEIPLIYNELTGKYAMIESNLEESAI